MGLRRTIATAVLAAVAFGGAARAEDNPRGEVLFDLCSQCHGSAAEGNRVFLAPAIAGLSEWYVVAQLRKFRGGQRGTHFDDLSGMRMRPMSLTLRSEADVEFVARYVAALPPTNPEPQVEGGDAARGETHYALCGSCHGMKGEGSQPLNAPRLAHSSDWYLVSQLQKFKDGVLGANPEDPIAIMMRPMALVLPDEQALKDVVAYITTLSE